MDGAEETLALVSAINVILEGYDTPSLVFGLLLATIAYRSKAMGNYVLRILGRKVQNGNFETHVFQRLDEITQTLNKIEETLRTHEDLHTAHKESLTKLGS